MMRATGVRNCCAGESAAEGGLEAAGRSRRGGPCVSAASFVELSRCPSVSVSPLVPFVSDVRLFSCDARYECGECRSRARIMVGIRCGLGFCATGERPDGISCISRLGGDSGEICFSPE